MSKGRGRSGRREKVERRKVPQRRESQISERISGDQHSNSKSLRN